MHDVLGTVPGCLHDGSVPASRSSLGEPLLAFMVFLVGSVCGLQKGGTVGLGLLVMAPQKAELGRLCCCAGVDAAAFLLGAEQLSTTAVWG